MNAVVGMPGHDAKSQLVFEFELLCTAPSLAWLQKLFATIISGKHTRITEAGLKCCLLGHRKPAMHDRSLADAHVACDSVTYECTSSS